MHMFIVMMGRLSYADPPEWLAAELKAEIEQIVGKLSSIPDTGSFSDCLCRK